MHNIKNNAAYQYIYTYMKKRSLCVFQGLYLPLLLLIISSLDVRCEYKFSPLPQSLMRMLGYTRTHREILFFSFFWLLSSCMGVRVYMCDAVTKEKKTKKKKRRRRRRRRKKSKRTDSRQFI